MKMKWFLILSVLLCISCTKASNNNLDNVKDGSIFSKELKGNIENKAKENDPIAQYLMGGLYVTGEMGEIDYNKSFDWYMKSALQGNAKAQYQISLFYSQGLGGAEKDLQKSFNWGLKAAEQNDFDAIFYTGVAYYDGLGVKQDQKKALEYFFKLAKMGRIEAQRQVAKQYSLGKGVVKNLEQAFYWDMQAAKQGDSESEYNVGYYYQNGVGVKKDAVEATKWFKLAADKNDPEASFELAKKYMDGDGVEQDGDKYIYYLEKSGELKYKPAIDLLIFLYDDPKLDEHYPEKNKYWKKKLIEANKKSDDEDN